MKACLRIVRTGVVVIAVLSLLAFCGCGQGKPSAAGTLGNLLKAYDGESNANARYMAFAKKADEEGYGQVASLFRAAAAAEEIHLTNHAEMIKKLGGTPETDIKTPEVKSTKENLESAVTGESYERDTMYPEFVATAEKENQGAVVEVFQETKSAEGVHAKLYAEAIANLDAWKVGPKDFFVCPECGNVVMARSFAKCPICQTPVDMFKTVT